jgi:hypothetical protein
MAEGKAFAEPAFLAPAPVLDIELRVACSEMTEDLPLVLMIRGRGKKIADLAKKTKRAN